MKPSCNENELPRILYQDPYITVCQKRVGLPSQPTSAGGSNLLDLLAEKDPDIGLVHRLDTLTGGVMVYATRKGNALGQLCTSVQDHNVFIKEYLAVTDRPPIPTEGEMLDRLFHDKRINKSFVVTTPRKGSKDARLAYRALHTAPGGSTLVHVRLYTGRTHQIRVQFGSRGWPLCGDGKYGSRNNRCPCALWAHRISFPHPSSKKTVSFSCLPDTSEFPWNVFPQDVYENIENI